MMSKPVCPDHGEIAVFRSPNGYWFCPWCLSALFEWNRWIRRTLVPEDKKAEMRLKNYEIAEEYKRRAQAQKDHERSLEPAEITDCPHKGEESHDGSCPFCFDSGWVYVELLEAQAEREMPYVEEPE